MVGVEMIVIVFLFLMINANTLAWSLKGGIGATWRSKHTHISYPRRPTKYMALIVDPDRDRFKVDTLSDTSLDLPKAVQTLNKMAVCTVKGVLELVYKDRPYAKFAALETIARVPYFSYTSVLHLYETFGWFRKKEYIQIHFAESWNEMHHLLIMEELGGTKEFFDRFVAQHIAFFYYWMVVVLYMVSPAIAYDLNKQVEIHAYNTYLTFLKSNEAELKGLPAPQVAKDYYQSGDLYMFDAFQYHQAFKQNQSAPLESALQAIDGSVAQTSTAVMNPSRNSNRNDSNSGIVDHASTVPEVDALAEESTITATDTLGSTTSAHSSTTPPRRPVVETLYDVFSNICADEAEHADTMGILQRDVCLRNRGKE